MPGCALVLALAADPDVQASVASPPMSRSLILVLGLLVLAIAMFAMNRPRMDAVALIMLVALPFTGAVTMPEALAGFADPNIVLIGALFVIGEGLVRTGVANRMGDWLIRVAGRSETKLLVLLMICVCGLGSFMSSTAVTAIFIPVALRIATATGAAPGRLMMPLSFAALISGMMTLVATAPNLVVDAELVRQGATGFHFFSFTPFGVPIFILGILYMLVARRWLPAGEGEDETSSHKAPTFESWIEQYGLTGREYQLRVRPGSPLIGRSLKDLEMRLTAGGNVLAISRLGRHGRRELLEPAASTELGAGDVLLVDRGVPSAREGAPEETIEQLCERLHVEALPMTGDHLHDRGQEIGMAEVIVPADSALVGRTILESCFRTRTGVTAIGLRRGRDAVLTKLIEEKLQVGDTLLVVGPWKRIQRLTPDHSGVVVLRLPIEVNEVLPAPGKALRAVAVLLLVIGLMVSGVVPNVHAALIGCMLMGALGCLDLGSAYRSINWKTLILIVGMLPFSLALQRTGGVTIAADALTSVIGEMGPRAILAALFLITAGLGMFISNTATAVLMAPVAIALAREIGASPYPFAMTTAIAASTAFVTPVSSPVNTLVVTPGNYTFGDFVKVGGPFAIIVLIVTVLMVPLILPIFPAS